MHENGKIWHYGLAWSQIEPHYIARSSYSKKLGGCFDQCMWYLSIALHDYNLSWKEYAEHEITYSELLHSRKSTVVISSLDQVSVYCLLVDTQMSCSEASTHIDAHARLADYMNTRNANDHAYVRTYISLGNHIHNPTVTIFLAIVMEE